MYRLELVRGFAWGVSRDGYVRAIAPTDALCRAACFSRSKICDREDGSRV